MFLASALISSLVVLRNKKKSECKSFAVNNNKTEIEIYKGSNGNNKNINNAKVLHILGLFELTTKWGVREEGRREMAAAELAIKHINSIKLLPGYRLKLLTNDTKCDPGVGIDAFFYAIYSTQKVAMLLGTTCSNVTESLAHIVPYWNILHVSFGSSSPSLSDRTKFPLFFRTLAPESSHNRIKTKLIKHFGWNVVAMFYQSDDEFLLPLNNLVKEFESENISCLVTVTFSLDNYKDQLKILKDSELRIIIASFSDGIAGKIFCEIGNMGMFGRDYVWILQEREEQWWRSDGCANFWTFIDGLILVSDYDAMGNTSSLISRMEDIEPFSKYSRLAYDAVWAMALTLQKTSSYNLEEFDYDRRDIALELVSHFAALNFTGISGPLKFIGPDRVGSSMLRQLQGSNVNKVGIYDSQLDLLDFDCRSCYPISWQQTPVAQRILKLYLVQIPKFLFYSTLFISLIGIATSLTFLYFNLHFRRVKTVKLSSPNLNNVAVIGCILVYISVVFIGMDSSIMAVKYVDRLCTVRVYLLSAGFSLAFGSMFAKTYRIHRIFAFLAGTGKITGSLLKDKHLIVLILIPTVIDAIMVALWLTIDPMRRELYNLTLQINLEDRRVVYQPQVEVCRSQNTSGWFIAIYGYKGLLLIMAVFMAWETRHVKVQILNDSQYIGICVYGAVFSAIITILSGFITEYVVFGYLARIISILASTTLTLLLLFLPKLRAVFSHRQCQDPIMQSMGLKIEYNTRRFINNDPKEQIVRLEIQNKVFRCQLEALDVEISRLENLIQQKSTQIQVYTISGNMQEFGGDEKKNWGKCNAPIVGQRHTSNPEFHTSSIILGGGIFEKAASEANVAKDN